MRDHIKDYGLELLSIANEYREGYAQVIAEQFEDMAQASGMRDKTNRSNKPVTAAAQSRASELSARAFAAIDEAEGRARRAVMAFMGAPPSTEQAAALSALSARSSVSQAELDAMAELVKDNHQASALLVEQARRLKLQAPVYLEALDEMGRIEAARGIVAGAVTTVGDWFESSDARLKQGVFAVLEGHDQLHGI